jgi:hypothetical protein
MTKVRVARLVVTMRGGSGGEVARLGRQLAVEVGTQLGGQVVPNPARLRLELPRRPNAGDIRTQVSTALQHINKGRP